MSALTTHPLDHSLGRKPVAAFARRVIKAISIQLCNTREQQREICAVVYVAAAGWAFWSSRVTGGRVGTWDFACHAQR